MFYYASKLVWLLLQPSNAVALLVLVGAALVLGNRCAAVGRRALLAGAILLVVCGWSPLGNILLLPLESRFARAALPERAAGIIILGGFEQADISKSRGVLAVNDSAERILEGVAIAMRLPRARVIFSGGEGALFPFSGGAAAGVGAYLETVGIGRDRIVLEDRSRTTYENALYLKDILRPRPGERFVLVTSAFHMPRAIGTFRRQGFEVVPWTVDYRTRGPLDVIRPFDGLLDGFENIDVAAKEWVGLLAYWISGRSSALWPAAEAPGAGARGDQ